MRTSFFIFFVVCASNVQASGFWGMLGLGEDSRPKVFSTSADWDTENNQSHPGADFELLYNPFGISQEALFAEDMCHSPFSKSKYIEFIKKLRPQSIIEGNFLLRVSNYFRVLHNFDSKALLGLMGDKPVTLLNNGE